MAKKKSLNWLLDPISPTGLLNIGFELVAIDESEQFGHACTSKVRIENTSQMSVALYFQPLDVVAYQYMKNWRLALDSNSNSVWHGKLTTMADLVAVLILLSK